MEWARARGTAIVALVASAGLLVLAAEAGAATITVNSTADATTNDGTCTLREAITAANGNAASGAAGGECGAGQVEPTQDTIAFSIAGAGPHVITPGSDLPAITELVAVDGSTDVNPGPGDDEIRLDGANTVTTGLDVEGAAGVEIRELSITRFIVGLDLADTTDVEVEDSHVGTNEAGAASLGNSGGIRLGSGTAPATGASISSSVISGNSSYGVQIADSASDGNTITGNLIGTTPGGASALANGVGVTVIDGADDTVIGGATLAEGNVVSGNTSTGIEVLASATEPATGSTIQGNRIGTGIGGEAALPNTDGILLAGAVGQTTIRSNLISGNSDLGVRLTEAGIQVAAPSETTIADNLIGTDKDGVQGVGNGDGGVGLLTTTVASTGNVVGGETGLTAGGACTGDCNVIADNGSTLIDSGVLLGGPDASGTEIVGNHIGVDVTGLAVLGNSGRSVNVAAGGTGIRVGSAAGPNVIAGSGAEGIVLDGNAGGVSVQGNLLGVGSDGSTTLGTGSHGILVRDDSSFNLIGGTGAGEGNVIANSGDDGVRVGDTADANAIVGNSITASGGLGIDLFGPGGPNANDGTGDPDTGPNELQNYPELTGAVTGTSTFVGGRLDSEESTSYRIEVFANSTADASGYGEGETFLGAFTVTTDANGEAQFGAALAGIAAAGDSIVATATELGPAGQLQSTSEFSESVTEGCDNAPTSGADLVTGTAGDDVLCGSGGNDTFEPGAGNDLIVGGAGAADRVDYSDSNAAAHLDLAQRSGTVGNDRVAMLEVEDLAGTQFQDELTGDALANDLDGGEGEDDLDGGGGADDVDGGTERDTVLGGTGADDLDGAEGSDTVRGGDGSDVLRGADGGDTLKGEDGGDTLKGDDGSDKLRGAAGADTLKGGDGSGDNLGGGDGKDSLNGGSAGKDICNGNAGHDERRAPGCETKRSIP